MSSNTITVNPRKRTARSPPPVVKTDDSAAPKGTVLLRNPLPKYSFQSKLDKNAGKTNKDTKSEKDKVENKTTSDSEVKSGKVSFELESSGTKPPDKEGSKFGVGRNADDTCKPRQKEKSNPNADLRIGVLVNSFPQNSVTLVDQTADIQTSKNGDKSSKIVSNDPEPVIIKTMIEKTKPVNVVDPITSSSSGTRLSHSYSESAISATPSGFHTQRETISVGRPSQSVQEESNSQQGTSDSGITEFAADDSVETTTETMSTAAVCQCKDRIRQLEEEKQLLKQQLEVQLQVNCELKKLLVASVGEDLHHRVERLTRDKALMSLELGDYSRKLSEDYEHLDKISIQADMWRSKYLASRVMTDELASAKAFYTMQFHECQMALQQLLNERHELRANLFETYRGLHQIRGAFDPLNSEPSSNQLTSKNVLDLARANQQLAEAIKYRLLPSHVTASLASKIEPDWHDYLTKAETHARELLAREVRPEDFRHLVPKSLTAPLGMTVDRFHPCTRFDNLTINVCCKCKGDVTIV